MATTKKTRFSFPDSLKFGNGESIFDKSRYSNLHLKRNHSLISTEAVHSNSSNERRKSPPFLDYTYDNEQRKDMMKWRKRESSSRTSDLMEIDNNIEKIDKIDDKISSPNNKSSLSLHISAYENSLDTVKANEKRDELKDAESKNDFFNFPRQQQQNQKNRVETMEFRLSTKLLNPYPLVTASELDSADESEIDDEKEYAEIKAKSLQSLVVVIPDSKQPKPSKIKKNLNELKTKISTEKSLIKKNLVTLDKDILRSAEIKKQIMDEICERIREQRIVSNQLIDDLRHYQKRTLNAIKARSDALKNYQKLENEEDEIRLNLMEMKRNDLW